MVRVRRFHRIHCRSDVNRGSRFCRQGRNAYLVDSSCFLVGPVPPFSLVFGVIVPKLFPRYDTRNGKARPNL